MHTITVTRSIPIAGSPEAVISLSGDPRQLPRWAPGFARRVLPHGEQWIAEAADGTRTRVTLRASPEGGTVDVLGNGTRPRGVYGTPADGVPETVRATA